MSANNLDALKKRLKDELEKDSIDFDSFYKMSRDLVDSDKTNVRFSVDARLIHKLGYELVGKQETALGELIKNAYDADATLVVVDYANYHEPGGTLTIIDDGHGMSEDTIRETWMRLSTDDKLENPFSPNFNRARAGRKGIGRLAVERLGKQLVLESNVVGADFGCRVSFSWDEALERGMDLGSVSFKLEKYPKDPKQYGTKLIIEQLRDRWTDKMLEGVWTSVVLLQTPVRFELNIANVNAIKDPGFQVVINGRSSTEVIKELSIEKSFLDKRLAKITGTIDSQGIARFSVKSNQLGLEDETTAENLFSLVGEITFEVDYFIYASELIPGFSEKTASKLGHKYGGVRVYRNGFRVLPYGESSDDWLKLAFDTARRNLLNPANNQNFFGQIDIHLEKNPLLEETSSREGLIENEAFYELRSFVRTGIEWAVQRVASIRDKKTSAGQKDWIAKKDRPSKTLEELLNEAALSKSAEEATSEESLKDETVSINKSALQQALSEQKKYEDTVAAQEAAHIRYEEMLRILASFGISISVFAHEVGGALTGVDGALLAISKQSKPDENSESWALVEDNMQRLRDLSGYISEMISHAGSRERRPIPLSAVISTFIREFSNYLNSKNIKFSHSVEPAFLRTAPMHRSEIDSVLFNFLTNAVKAVGRSKNTDRRISITAYKRETKAIIRFQDSGDGVSENIKEQIFDPFFTTSMYDPDVTAGTGTGLGLKIVHDIASANGGWVSLSDPDPGFGCCFEFAVPLSSGQQEGA